jgi:hypothetical protein
MAGMDLLGELGDVMSNAYSIEQQAREIRSVLCLITYFKKWKECIE